MECCEQQLNGICYLETFVLPKAITLGINGNLVNYFLDVCRAALVLGIIIEQSDLVLCVG